MAIGQGVEQLHINVHLVVGFLHAAFENIGNSKLTRDLTQVFGSAFVALSRAARNYFQVRNLCESRNNFVLDTSRKVLVVRIAAEIAKRQDSNGFRARLRGKIGIFRPLEAFRRQFKRPRENERDRKTDDNQKDDEPNDPIRNVEDREDLRDSLRKCPTRDDVSDSNFVNVATLQFTEEAHRIHRMASATRSTRGQEGDKHSASTACQKSLALRYVIAQKTGACRK